MRMQIKDGQGSRGIKTAAVLTAAVLLTIYRGSIVLAEEEQEPLTFAIWRDEESYVRKVAEAYNALKGKDEISLKVVPNEEYGLWISEYSDEDQVDIIDLKGNTHLLLLQKKGYLIGLGDYLQGSELDITAYGTMFNEIVYENEYYALPTRSTCWTLYYNKELFDELGKDYPEQMTWEEYHALASEISEQTEGTWGGYYPPWIYHPTAIQQGYYLLHDDLSPVKESLAFLYEIYSDGSHFPFDYAKDSAYDVRYDFAKGKVAMAVSGEWMANMLLEDEAGGADVPDWGIAPLPIPEEVEENTTFGMYQLAGITSHCTEPERAFEFLQFLCGEKGAQIYAQNAIIPAYSNEQIRKTYMNAVGNPEAELFFEAKKIQEQPMWYGYDRLMALFEERAEGFIEGRHTLEETMELFEEQRMVILSE